MARGNVCDNNAASQHAKTVIKVELTTTSDIEVTTHRAELCAMCMATYPVDTVRRVGKVVKRSPISHVRRRKGFRWHEHLDSSEGALRPVAS